MANHTELILDLVVSNCSSMDMHDLCKMKRVCRFLPKNRCVQYAEKLYMRRANWKMASFLRKVKCPFRLSSAVWRAMRNKWTCCISRGRMYIVNRSDTANKLSPYHLLQPFENKKKKRIPQSVVDNIYLYFATIMCNQGRLSRFMLMHTYSCMYTMREVSPTQCRQLWEDVYETLFAMKQTSHREKIAAIFRFCFSYVKRYTTSRAPQT